MGVNDQVFFKVDKNSSADSICDDDLRQLISALNNSFTITVKILARSLANFFLVRHMNITSSRADLQNFAKMVALSIKRTNYI